MSELYVWSDMDYEWQWRSLAACRGSDPNTWYPRVGRTGTVPAAKAVCAGCTVRPNCLAYAMDAMEHLGVWGGLTVRERERMRSLGRIARERFERLASLP